MISKFDKEYLKKRNKQIYKKFLSGKHPQELANEYFLTIGHVRNVIRLQKLEKELKK